jgi:type I restriction enzyme, S subunit
LDPIRRPAKGDVLYTLVGSFGIPIIVTDDRPFCVQRHIGILRPSKAMSAVFIRRALESKWVFNQANACATGIAQKTVSLSGLRNILIPVPPLAEQHRIVAKVDELMAVCDRLEAAQKERENRRDRLAASSLNRLNNGADADTFRDHARFYFNHLPRLTTRREHIKQLRQTILNLAVRGKLVPQDTSGEPAEDMAEPPDNNSAPQTGDREAPFELPNSWQWMQLGQVSELINGDRSKNHPNKAEYVREGVAWINTGHIEPDGTLSTNSMHYITRKKFDSLRSGKVRPGDLVYCLRGATLGKTAIITQFDEGAVASSLVIVRLSPAVDPRFAYQVLMSPLGREQIFQFDNGSAQPNLSANNVKKYWIPIPPLAEQQRIIAKVEELMAVCDRLETQLTTTQTHSRRFLEAVLQEALAWGALISLHMT